MLFHNLKWQVYFGEDPEAALSDDEDYTESGRKAGYNRDEMNERDAKWKAVQAFEKSRAGAVEVLHAPEHRGLMASVRPERGAEAAGRRVSLVQ